MKWINRIQYTSFSFSSSVDESLSSNIQPDGYKLHIWNNDEIKRDKPMIVPLTSKENVFLSFNVK